MIFEEVLFTTLIANCPKDTGNMVANITIKYIDDIVEITISGPKTSAQGFYDYARAVNYNQQRTPKEARNYEWIERSIKQVSHLFGREVRYELS